MAATDRHLFTSESVTEGHPDKLSDHISDAVLDAVMAADPRGRVACETLVTTGLCVVAGEITTSAKLDFTKIARETIREVGYTRPEFGFDYQNCDVVIRLDEQSPDIAMGVDPGGAGDQGLMFGFACDETPELMPAPIMLAHKLVRKLSEVRRSDELDYLRPDGKSQVTVEYVEGKPARVDAVVISSQHSERVDIEKLRREITDHVIRPIIPGGMIDADTKFHINPHRQLRRGWSARRHRPDRTQDHRRFLRWDGPSRRRCFLRQGPDEGRPFRLLHGAAHRQEHRRGRARTTL